MISRTNDASKDDSAVEPIIFCQTEVACEPNDEETTSQPASVDVNHSRFGNLAQTIVGAYFLHRLEYYFAPPVLPIHAAHVAMRLVLSIGLAT